MATKIIKALIDGVVQEIEVEDIISPEQMLSPEERLDVLEDKHEVVITDGNLLVGNGTTELEEMTPEEMLFHINGASVATMTTAEYTELEQAQETNANTLYMLTDAEEAGASDWSDIQNVPENIVYASDDSVEVEIQGPEYVKYVAQSLTDDQKTQVRTNIGAASSDMGLLSIYPVGSIYMSTVNTSPASFLGGTWTALKDRFLLGAGGSYAIGATGGEASVLLNSNNIPRVPVWSDAWGQSVLMGHSVTSSSNPANPGFAPSSGFTGGKSYTRANTIQTGQESPLSHNNMPPYLAVYMWQRTA